MFARLKSALSHTSILAVLLFGFAVVGTTGVAYAACPGGDTAEGQVLRGIGEGGGDCDDSGVAKVVRTAISLLSYVAGVAAIIMIIYSGLKYITSGGDAGKVSSAKSTLIYALIGVAVAVLAQLFVRVIITQADITTKSCPAGSHRSQDGKNCVPD